MVADHKLVFILMGFDGWWNRWDLSVCHTIVGDVTIVRVFCLMIDNSCNSLRHIVAQTGFGTWGMAMVFL